MLLSTDPWSYMEHGNIEMGKFKGTGVALFQFIQVSTLYIGILMISVSIICIIATNKAENIESAKGNIQFKLIIIFLIGMATFLMSLLMSFCNQLFGLK